MILSIGMVFHTVEAESMSLSTNSDIYYNGDYIVAFGSVSTIFEEMPVTIQIYHDANLISVAQVPVAADGTYAATFTAVGNQWMDEGTYSIRSFYTPTILAESTFDFYNQIIDKSSAEFPVEIPNSGTFDVGYTIRGGEVKDIEMNMDRYSILVQVTMDTNGNLILKLPRESFDAQSDGTDENFIILVSKENTSPENFMNVEYEDVAIGSEYRTIRIPLEEGDKWVEIIGTYIIPEFGSIAIIILVVAVSSAIIISKNRLSIRYN
jgi:predicted secreted protein with PEFG-CTERM motif